MAEATLVKLTLLSGTPGVDLPSDVKYKVEPLDPTDTVPTLIPSNLLAGNNKALVSNRLGLMQGLDIPENGMLVNLTAGGMQAMLLSGLAPFIIKDNETVGAIWSGSKIIEKISESLSSIEGMTNPLVVNMDIAGFKIVSGADDILEKTTDGVKIGGQNVLPTHPTELPADGLIPYVVDVAGKLYIGFKTEASGGGSMTNAEVKTAYESNANTNAFTDAEKASLGTMEDNATADQTAAEIKTAYQSQAKAFTDAQFDKLALIEDQATSDLKASEVKSLYESESDTNAYTDAEKAKLTGLVDGTKTVVMTGTDSTFFLDSSNGSDITIDWKFAISPAILTTYGLPSLVTLVSGTNENAATKDIILQFTDDGLYALDISIGAGNNHVDNFSGNLIIEKKTIAGTFTALTTLGTMAGGIPGKDQATFILGAVGGKFMLEMNAGEQLKIKLHHRGSGSAIDAFLILVDASKLSITKVG